MHKRLTSRFTLVLALSLVAIAALAATGADAAEPWGEIAHFADKGELQQTQPAFGINPEDGSAWVGDIAENAKHEPMLRVQKFKREGVGTGAWKVVASDEFGSALHSLLVKGKTEEANLEIKGIAFDPELHRAYVLVEEERFQKEEETNAAAQLWEFTTNTPSIEGKALVDRTESATYVPFGESSFDPQASATKGSHLSLNEPSGIAVDPKTHDVLITGYVGTEKNPIATMWEISKEGKIEDVWEDGTGKAQFFEEGSELNSPVVTPSGQILVLGDGGERSEAGFTVFLPEQIYEMPAALKTGEAPKVAYTQPGLVYCKEYEGPKPCTYVENLTQFAPGEGGTISLGGHMAAGPEGNIYVNLHVKNASEAGVEEGGLLVLNSKFEEQGWTGGGAWVSASKACAVNETELGGVAALVGAGKETAEGRESAFMYEPGDGTGEGEVRVLQLGPGGSTSNCPMPSATLTATAGGSSVEGIAVPIADKVAFETKLVQGNAISTEWEVEPGVVKPVDTREQQSTKFEYKFAKPGTFTVKEAIRTDDLAMPSLTKSITVEIAGPVVQHEEATVEGGTAATLKAEVDPSGQPTTCEFQYEEVGGAAKTKPCSPQPGSAEEFVKETAKVEGLSEGKEYRFRLVAKTGEYHTEQAGVTFKTLLKGAPEAHTEAASAMTSSEATLNGKVNPEGSKTHCSFEWGKTVAYEGGTVPCSSEPEGTSAVSVTALLKGLVGGTTYHFRLLAENGHGNPTAGSDLTLTTPAAATAPAVTSGAATSVSQTAATIRGTVNPDGAATTCRFEYGTSNAYGASAACPVAPGEGRNVVEESLTVAGLSPSTTYHFRIVASNSQGSPVGADATFTTLASAGGGGSGGGGATTPPKGEVQPNITVKPVPNVLISGSALTVAASGSFSLKLSCPAGETACTGSVTLKTLTAVAASAHAAKAKKAILTLATGSFTVAGGKLKAITLHLGSKAKALLAKLHTVRARVTIVAHDTQGGAHTTSAIVTLKAAKKKH